MKEFWDRCTHEECPARAGAPFGSIIQAMDPFFEAHNRPWCSEHQEAVERAYARRRKALRLLG